MATTGIINGTALGVYDDGTLINHATSCTLNLNLSLRDASTKDSAGWSDSLEGRRDWSVDVDALYALDATHAFTDLFAHYNARTTLSVRFSTQTSGDKYYHGTVYVASLSVNAASEDSTSYSVSFTGTGALTESSFT